MTLIKFFTLTFIIHFFITNYECSIDFSLIGIDNFKLGSTFVSVTDKYPMMVKNEEHDDGIIVYSYQKKIDILNEIKVIDYFLFFKNSKLISYHFEIDIGNDVTFFRNFINELKKLKVNDDFINSHSISKYNYYKSSNKCYKFLSLKQTIDDKLYIKGGVSLD
tara:strand:+ start:9938 stop:10426 length:489 start_codon:yes stop_codon:yes gene_type:complete